MSMYFRLDHGKPAALHNIDNITLLMRLVGYKAKTSNPTMIIDYNNFPTMTITLNKQRTVHSSQSSFKKGDHDVSNLFGNLRLEISNEVLCALRLVDKV